MENLRDRLKDVYGGRKWILAAQAAVITRGIIERLEEWESEALIVASNAGTGELSDAEIVYTRSRGDTILTSIREFYESVERPTAETQAAVDRFDPDRCAAVIAEPHATAMKMLGRPTFGVRRPEWSAWEDKMRVDQLWEELGIALAPYRIVAPSDAPEAADDLSTDLGTVWVADNSRGWHGGGELVRWVNGPEEYEENSEWFAAQAARVRVMPFLDGLPCSIHGWVTATGVAVFLPVEILIMRHADRGGFAYAGVATVWEAEPDVEAAMRYISEQVGRHLFTNDGYLGPYGIDGVLTPEGFRPTELNPRMSAGAGVQLGTVDLPLGLLMRAEIEGRVQVDHEWLQQTAIEQRSPVFHFGRMVTKEVRAEVYLAMDNEGSLFEVGSEEGSLGKITAGPSATGSYIMGDFEAKEFEVGKPVGPLVAEALNIASRKWDLGWPKLVAAPYLTS